MNDMHAALIRRFFEAFGQLDAETMGACYAGDAVFSDPVFGDLHGGEIGDMWRMLTKRAEHFELTFDSIYADEREGSAQWAAQYVFPATGRHIVNRVNSAFAFSNGRIVMHRDSFDLWRWCRQALGVKGALLGWSPIVQRAVARQARARLAQFREQ